ncbi:GNAT family N-acetyltransferase [Kitasatospora sp. NPDC006697]|uniref:GNAT family N-acetyltransferase n=1 Tax=Kitasatospora sp. NPDC006697 TaxID=3364020 RepID=UPI00369035B5
MTDLTIRSAGRGEATVLLDFWARAAKGTSVSDDIAGVTALLERDPEAVLVAERDGALVGTVIAGWDGWRASLYRLAVAPECRRQGIAAALLQAAELRFTALGARRADAMVLDANPQAHHAWRACGYGREDQWRRWTKPLADRS